MAEWWACGGYNESRWWDCCLIKEGRTRLNYRLNLYM